MKDKFLPYKLIGDATYPMWPWFYFPFQNEKDGVPKYKANLILYNLTQRCQWNELLEC
jgi:hypothetical protein